MKKKPQGPCYRCGAEGSEFCWLCHRFLCDECLDVDYGDHKEEAKRWIGQQHSPLSAA